MKGYHGPQNIGYYVFDGVLLFKENKWQTESVGLDTAAPHTVLF